METATLGKTGLKVSRIGLGLSEIGKIVLEDAGQAGEVLNAALDYGINFLDTAACYGNSEELIGLHVAGRRGEYVLASKCGHVAGGYDGQPWTAQTVRDSIDRSLRRMKTDHVDLMQLHSCEVDVLERGDVIRELQKAKQAGKTRFIGYSGDDASARWAIESGLFDTLQTSFNLVDQRARTELFPLTEARGMGIIAKRPVANGAWGASAAPSGYASEYFRRAGVMTDGGKRPAAPNTGILVPMGFTLAHPEVDTAIIGTRNPDHLRSNVGLAERKLPIDADIVEALRRRYSEVGKDWPQMG